jgi:hypothetical protein
VRRSDRATGRLVAVNLIACLLLLVQYLLGLVTNLFVSLPANHPGANSPDYFGGLVPAVAWVISQGSIWAAIHASLGLALIVGAVVLAVLAVLMRMPAYAATAIVGALAIIGAGFNGASFVIYGHNFSSMIMGGVWALALACYAFGLYLLARRPAKVY